MLAKVDLLAAAVQPSVRACQLLQNGYPKMVSLHVRPHSAQFIKLRTSTLILAANAAREWKIRASQSASLPGRELDEVEAGEDLQLDSAVFEEVFPSVEKVEKPVGARVKGLPSPQSTLIPDDWKAVQDYYHRSKKQRKQERLELELEWARKRTLEERATQEEIRELEQKSLRGQDIRSAGDVVVGSGGNAVDKWQERQMEDGETGVPAPNVVSGRATPKDFRSELQFSSLEDIAQSLREAEAESTHVETERSSKRDSEGVPTPASNEKTFLLTAEEKAMLRSKNLDFSRISSKTWSPLHTLAASGQVYLAAELLKKGVDPDVVDSDGLTPLHRAVLCGRKTMIRMLLKAGANARVFDKVGATLLHYSAQIGNEEISKLLLRHGVDVNAADEDGWTALHVAVQSGRLELIKALVYRGADLFVENKDGNTALDLALAFGGCFNFYDAIKFLKKKSVFDGSNNDENDQPI